MTSRRFPTVLSVECMSFAIRSTFVLVFILGCSSNVLSDSSPEARDALRHSTDSSWYSYDSDKLVFPNSAAMEEPAKKLSNRHDFIVKKPDPTPASSTPSKWDWSWLDAWWDGVASLFSNIWFVRFAYLTACVLLGVLIYFLVRYSQVGSFGFYKNRKSKLKVDNTQRDQARIIDLPFPIQNLKTDLWSEVLRLRDQQEYAQAIVYLFGHILVELDAASCIRLQRGKTNRIYLKELRDKAVLRELHVYLVERFESVFFGRHTIEQQQFEETFQTANKIKAMLIEARAASVNQLSSDRTPGKQILDEPTVEGQSAEKHIVDGDLLTANAASVRSLIWIALLSGACCAGGCGFQDLSADQLYGESSISGVKKSIASLSVFRSMCEQNGLTSAHLNGLSSRNKQLDIIVFAPKAMRTPTPSEIKWFDAWLREQPERRLILIGRDFSPNVRYWNRAMESANALDRVVFANQKAIAETVHEELRWQEPASSPCDWFKLVLRPSKASDSNNLAGPWQSTIRSGEFDAPLRGYFEPQTKSITTMAPAGAHPDFAISDGQDIASTFTVERLIETNDGRPLLFSMESPQWTAGKVYVFANGSILLNEGLTYSGHRTLAQQLISSLPKKGKIGFLSPNLDTYIRSDTERQEASGFELLRVWPLSLISMQALFIGFIVLLALFPIFGRPQRPIKKSNTDFGLHIEALGQLLQRSQDKSFALHKIASYFRDVRKEPNSPWSQIAPPSKEFSNDRVVPKTDRT